MPSFDPDVVPAERTRQRALAREWIMRQLRLPIADYRHRDEVLALLRDEYGRGLTPRQIAAGRVKGMLVRDVFTYGEARALQGLQALLDLLEGREPDLRGLPAGLLEALQPRQYRLEHMPDCTHIPEPGWCECRPRRWHDDVATPERFRGFDPCRVPRDGWERQVALWWLCHHLGIAVIDLSAAQTRDAHEFLADLYVHNGQSPSGLLDSKNSAEFLYDNLLRGWRFTMAAANAYYCLAAGEPIAETGDAEAVALAEARWRRRDRPHCRCLGLACSCAT